MKPSHALEPHRAAIRAIVLLHHARNARVFGSVAQGVDAEGSDLDILVDTTPDTTLFDLGAIPYKLRSLLGVPVDVLTPGALPEGFRQAVVRNFEIIGAASKNTARSALEFVAVLPDLPLAFAYEMRNLLAHVPCGTDASQHLIRPRHPKRRTLRTVALLEGRERSAFVRAAAKRLRLAQAASTPPIVFTGLDRCGVGRFLGNVGVHGGPLGGLTRLGERRYRVN